MTAVAVFPVDDPDDPRIADYRNIPDPVLMEDRRLFVAEGRLVVRRLLAAKRLPARSILVTAPALASIADVMDERVPTYLVAQNVMNAVTGFNIHRGCLAIGERGTALDWRALANQARTLVVLERVANADNIGAVFRNAAAFAADAVLLGPACADPLYRKSIRTSMAAALDLPVASMEPWPGALGELGGMGFDVVGLSLSPHAPALREAFSDARSRIALVAGHEGEGLTDDAVSGCQSLARIPMTGRVDSLNVATAIGVALYERYARMNPAGRVDQGNGQW